MDKIRPEQIEEVRQVIGRLKRRDEFDALSTKEADAEAISIMLDLFEDELTQEEATELWNSTADGEVASDSELEAEVRATVLRASEHAKS